MTLLLILGLVVSIALTAMSISLRELSTPYLRHWARRGDAASKALYPLKARGTAALLTIELFRSLSVSGTLVLLTLLLVHVVAWLVGAIILFLVFIVLIELYMKPFGTKLLIHASGSLLWLAQALKPVVLPLGRTFDRFIAEQPVNLTRNELMHNLEVIESADTDLSADELRILKHALVFGEKTVHDIMTPRSVIVSTKQDDVLSPSLLDGLHKSGHSRFPVFGSEGDQAVGILYLKDLLDLRAHTKVQEIMHKPAHYVNENRELDHVLQAFIRTKQHLFLVVNEFAEVTGLVTIEDVIEQVLGKPIIDEFDRYDSMRDVAAARAKIVRKTVKMVE